MITLSRPTRWTRATTAILKRVSTPTTVRSAFVEKTQIIAQNVYGYHNVTKEVTEVEKSGETTGSVKPGETADPAKLENGKENNTSGNSNNGNQGNGNKDKST